MHDSSAPAHSCKAPDACCPLRCRANVSGCALNFSPCTFDGQVQTTMPTVQDIGFNMVQPTAFELAYLGAPNNSVATTNMVRRCGLNSLQPAVGCTLWAVGKASACVHLAPLPLPCADCSPARLQADAHSIGYQVINSTSCGAVHFSNLTQDFFNYQYATYARSVLPFG